MTTMRDVAALAGVSAKTVSRVHNGDPHVLPETRARVEDALRRLGYVPNALATSFRAGRAPVIGVAVPDLVDPFFGAMARAAADLAADHGMAVVVTGLGDDDPSRERPVVEALLRQSLSGLVVAAVSHDQSYLSAWAARTPLVFVDREPAGVLADSFVADDRGGAAAATAHLLGHGHRRVGFLGDAPTVPTTRDRHAGYAAALGAAGLDVDDALVAFGARSRPGAAAAVEKMLAADDPPTAVFSSDARCTMAVLPRLAGSGLSLASFGDFPLADVVTPAVTVVDHDPAELGRLAVRRVLDRGAHPGRRFRRRTVLPVRLVERDSCADLRTAGPGRGRSA